MATFQTPEPISATIDVFMGDVQVSASSRTDTVVEVRPSDPGSAGDVEAAERVKVTCSRGQLLVKAPKPKGFRTGPSRGGSVDVTIELPEGSNVAAGSAWATFRTDGRLGECRIETLRSDIHLDQTGKLRVGAVGGGIIVGRVVGDAEITNVSGEVRVTKIDGTAVIKNEHGDSTIGEVTGPLRLSSTNGDFSVGQALGNVKAKTAHGTVRIGEIVRGKVEITTAFGDIEIGIRQGTAAKLEARTVSGQIRNSLQDVDGPAQTDEIAEVRAETFNGDVVIRRS
jgi:DUF4097 and DUF4098 domain-containing protein YvlB